ncbi:Y-family DNA polymerase [Rhodovulum sulfidophilum]|uniref:Y-family DNA polymerase n=1 Tax=Rhodovulum sulfidophilum TaxID=35806 RepID=UPI0009512D8A|nr:DNA polymerase Y family protein [Rhodovulum sulfidophilum]MBL3552997.1 DNA polymerase Y family protein [Rhodovulum sulfidophilum]OLS48989.1 nucleotidyltransferase [Rhodovulum sulfidophilum]
MFSGTHRRIVSIWFPRLASDRVLRARPVEGPFALSQRIGSNVTIYCLNTDAERAGLHPGMRMADARSFCPSLISQPARPDQDARFLRLLRRWAERYCPWVGLEGADGLVLDITGSAHLFGGEAAMVADMQARLARVGVTAQLGLALSRGAAWAVAHFGGSEETLLSLPVAALRLPADTVIALQRLGLRKICDLTTSQRAPLARRFGQDLLTRLDQCLGHAPEPVTPEAEPPQFATRMTLPEPIGLQADVQAALERLLTPLCQKLATQEKGARRLCLTMRRVDQASQHVELRLAAPMRDPERILPLFARRLEDVDAGFGIDQMRLEAVQVEKRAPPQSNALYKTAPGHATPEQLVDLITRIGTRIGLENIQRFLPAESHIPERAFLLAPAAFSAPQDGFTTPRPRPLRLFPPEPIAAQGTDPPRAFRWRGMRLSLGRAIGPERIAPEWWSEEENWRRGLRDYWRMETREGRRLWMFYTPQDPGWFVQGEFA